jgi:hypothetical protein
MCKIVATCHWDNDPDNSRRYIRWAEHTLCSDGSVIIESGRTDTDLIGVSASAIEEDPIRKAKWSDLQSDRQEALKKDAASRGNLTSFELATRQD